MSLPTDAPVPAYLNHGRWVVDCPGCNNSWLVDLAAPLQLKDARGGLHTACFCGRRLPAQFPADVAAIEQLMDGRPELNRNWRPGETLADLRIENAAYGVTA